MLLLVNGEKGISLRFWKLEFRRQSQKVIGTGSMYYNMESILRQAGL